MAYVTVLNLGPSAAISPSVTITIPGTLTAAVPAACESDASLVTCGLDDLAVNESSTVPLELTLPAVLPGGSVIELSASVTAPSVDGQALNDSAAYVGVVQSIANVVVVRISEDQ